MDEARYLAVLEQQLREWQYEIERIQQVCKRSSSEPRRSVEEALAVVREEFAAFHHKVAVSKAYEALEDDWRHLTRHIDACWELLGFTA